MEGEICLTGPSVMMEYVDNPEETANTPPPSRRQSLWLHTGDLGKMDEDGFVYFSQRIKRMIVTSGYNVYPGQLENVIDGHEKVLLSCVIGVKDPYKMQRVKAFVVLKPGYEPTDAVRDELMAYCREHIAKYAHAQRKSSSAASFLRPWWARWPIACWKKRRKPRPPASRK